MKRLTEFSAAAGGEPPTLEAILAQEAWLRRLAGALLSDRSRADDLAQDVMVAALQSRPRAHGAGLRAWLRTTARRMAARSSSREGYRERVETEAHRLSQQREGRAADESLEVSESIVHALQGISPEGRTAVVLRFLEEREYPAIAAALEISVPGARQRVARGLSELRQRLDGDFGDRASWVAALAAVVVPRSAPTPGATGTTPVLQATGKVASMGLLAWTTKKSVLMAVGLVAVLAATAALQRSVLREPGDFDPAAENALMLADSGDDALEGAASVEVDPRGASRTALGAGNPGEQAAVDPFEPQFSIVNHAGVLPAGAKAAWVAPSGPVELLPLDASGAGRLAAQEGVLVAGAPGHSYAFLALDGESLGAEPVTLVLGPLRSLAGRIELDGGPPGRPLEVQRWDPAEALPLSDDDTKRRRRVDRLVELGVLSPRRTAVMASAQGQFLFEGLEESAGGTLYLPDSVRRTNAEDSRMWGYSSSSQELVLKARSLPYVLGRFVWSGTQEPVEGDVLVHYQRSGRGHGTSASMRLLGDGRFELGLPEDSEALGAERRRDSGLVVVPEPDFGKTSSPPLEIDVSDVTFPHDVGTIPLDRARTLRLRVVGPGGEPIAGAKASTQRRADEGSDAAGVLELELADLEPFDVMARGYVPCEIDPGAQAISAEPQLPLEVALKPCVALRLVARGWTGGSATRSIPRRFVELVPSVLIDVQEAPPGEESAARGALQDRLLKLHRELMPNVRSSSVPGEPWQIRAACGDEALVVGPLRAQAFAAVGVIDAFGNELVRKGVTLGAEAETTEVVIDLGKLAGTSLTVEVVDVDGALIPDAWVMAYVPGVGGSNDPTASGSLVYAPVAPGSYEVRCSARGYLGARATGSLVAGPQVTRVTLERARSLRLAFVDDEGHPVRPRHVSLRSETGWRGNGAWHEATGEYRVDKAPQGAMTASVRLGTQTSKVAVSESLKLQTLRVPTTGRLEAVLDRPLALSESWAELRATICEVENEAATCEVRESVTPRATGALHLEEALLPGRYSVELVWIEEVGEDEDAFPRTQLFSGEVEVRAGETTRLPLNR